MSLLLLFKSGAAAQTLTPSLYTNTQTFFSATVTTGPVTLQPSLFTNNQTFFSPTITATNDLTPALYTNTQTFYSATVTQTGAGQNLTPDLYINAQIFYSPSVTTGAVTLQPLLFSNTQTFYSPTVVVEGGAQSLNPNLYTNLQTFFSVTVTQPEPIVLFDTHDGDKGKRRKKRWDEEQQARERRRAQIIDVYEQLVEGRPTVAEQIVAPYIQKGAQSQQIVIDFDRLLADVDRINRLYREYQEMDDEEVLLLL